MEKQTIFKATTTESVSDNSSRFGSEDNNDEVTKESKQKKKKTKAVRKKVSGMTRQEEIESKLLCYLLCRVKAQSLQ